MGRTLTFLYCLLYASASLGEQYRLIQLNRYGSNPTVEFLVNPDQGSHASEIFGVVKLPHQKFDLRLVYTSNSRNPELTSYYDVRYPDYYERTATDSPKDRNLAMDIFASHFETAFKSTSTYDELSGLIEKQGYSVYRISYEKILVSETDISAIDIYLHCLRVDAP